MDDSGLFDIVGTVVFVMPVGEMGGEKEKWASIGGTSAPSRCPVQRMGWSKRGWHKRGWVRTTKRIASRHGRQQQYGIEIHNHDCPQGETPVLCLSNLVIGVNTGTLFNGTFFARGEQHQHSVMVGNINIAPVAQPFRYQWDRAIQAITLTLSTAVICRNAIALWNHDQFTLSPQVNCYDPLITQLVLLLQSEFERNLEGRQGYLDSLINMLAVHLLTTYSTPDGGEFHRPGALPSGKLTTVLHYIQEHLDQKLDLDALATLADLSQYHFSRAFKHSTGFSPYQYIIQQRVFQAQSLLTQQTMSIGEVAIATLNSVPRSTSRSTSETASQSSSDIPASQRFQAEETAPGAIAQNQPSQSLVETK